jgi:hypothetical protein
MEVFRLDFLGEEVIYLWDVKHKSYDKKHVRYGWTLCQANLFDIGLGFDFHYSNNRMTNRYKRGGWLSLKFLWIDLMLSADWGNKAATDEAWKSAFQKLLDSDRTTT